MNNTLNNGLSLLSLIANSIRPYGVTELSQLTGLPKSHIHRLLQSLVEAQLLDKTEQGQYHLSLGILRLSRDLLLEMPIRRIALPAMAALSREVEVNLTLAMPFGDEAIAVAYQTHDGHLRDSAESLGTTLSISHSASGKLFLAHKSAEEQERILAQLENHHPSRLIAQIRSALPTIIAQGYSLRSPLNPCQSNGFALPIRDESGKVIAALGGYTGSGSLTTERLQNSLPHFQHAIAQIEQQLTPIAL